MDGGAWKATVHGVAEGLTRLSDFTFTSHFHALEKEMATHSSVLAWRIPGTGEPGGLPSVGSHRVGHDWSDLAAAEGEGDWNINAQIKENVMTSSICKISDRQIKASRLHGEIVKLIEKGKLSNITYGILWRKKRKSTDIYWASESYELYIHYTCFLGKRKWNDFSTLVLKTVGYCYRKMTSEPTFFPLHLWFIIRILYSFSSNSAEFH